ncbi:MAG: 30S ribosomal protein S17 [Chloroflexi bacterium]|nr:30S ribosomal protein S17 [Chloroflexota bacterium]
MAQTNRKVRIGLVISDKMDKTIVVAYEWRRRHRLYKKLVKRISKLYAHDEHNQCRVGDKVLIVETRPLSSTKRWKLVEILARPEMVEIKPQDIDVRLEEATHDEQTEQQE